MPLPLLTALNPIPLNPTADNPPLTIPPLCQAFFYNTMLDDAGPRGEPDLQVKLAWNAKMRTMYSDEQLLGLSNYAHCKQRRRLKP